MNAFAVSTRYAPNNPTLTDMTQIKIAFNAASRRVERMRDPVSATLVALLLAFGAFTSDHPAVVGKEAPTIEDIASSAWRGKDLSVWAEQRRAVCRTAVQTASKSVQAAALHKKPATKEALAAYIMMADLADFVGPPDKSAGRPYTAAAVAMLRESQRTNQFTAAYSSQKWTCCIQDAFNSATAGRLPLMCVKNLVLLPLSLLCSRRDEEIAFYLGASRFEHPDVAMVEAAITSTRPEVFAKPTMCCWYWAVSRARMLARVFCKLVLFVHSVNRD